MRRWVCCGRGGMIIVRLLGYFEGTIGLVSEQESGRI